MPYLDISNEQKIDKGMNVLISNNFALWSNLITINGIMLGTLSLIVSFTQDIPKWIIYYPFPFSVFLSFLSLIILIYNFYANKTFYIKYLQRLDSKIPDYSFNHKTHRKKIYSRYLRMRCVEIMAIFAFILNSCLIFMSILSIHLNYPIASFVTFLCERWLSVLLFLLFLAFP